MTLMDRYQCEGVVSLTSHWFQCYGNCSNSGVSSPGVSHTCLAHGVDPEAWESRVSCRCMQKAAGKTPLQMCFPLRSYNCPPSSLLHHSPASQGSISLWLLEEGFILRSPWDPWFPRSPLKSEPPSLSLQQVCSAHCHCHCIWWRVFLDRGTSRGIRGFSLPWGIPALSTQHGAWDGLQEEMAVRPGGHMPTELDCSESAPPDSPVADCPPWADGKVWSWKSAAWSLAVTFSKSHLSNWGGYRFILPTRAFDSLNQ